MALHETGVSTLNVSVVKLIYCVMPHFIISGTANKKK